METVSETQVKRTDRHLDDRVWVILHQPNSKQMAMLGRRTLGSKNSGEYGFFGGHIDPGETPRQSAKRELMEETGLEILELQDLKFVCAIERKDTYIFYFTLSRSELIDDVLSSTNEIDDYKLVDLTEYVSRYEDGMVFPCQLHYSVTLLLPWLAENGKNFFN